ncbi:rifin PIR protein, putative [Plasmodium reichenowi]|uniref:Rifin PIR protein, putative n=1 Tax=Plasmodium reichenowi TaxID=5854 RepID=A0A2P9D8I0_PLARE|nr:rifin PIR protein, putative [Plasmodium reichenowi]
MKVHYINILLFALPLNILVTSYHANSHKKIPSITPKIPTNRSLCECDLYMPNYDNDPQMKKVMEIFNRQTSQRFHEYDDRMQEKRKQCKDKCDKEIQKIILKDKLEKQMAQQLTTLDTNITTEDIPTCVCEKSLADKTEKFCLNCGKTMGGVAYGWGLISALGYEVWLNVATAGAIELATKKGIEEGVKAVIAQIENNLAPMLSGVKWSKYITGSNYSTARGIFEGFKNAVNSCKSAGTLKGRNISMVDTFISSGETAFDPYVTAGKQAAAATTKSVQKAELGKVAAEGTQLSGTIGYSVLAIVIIILIMMIIYWILRHRRKKKMKKKLQYIKLLEE